jgi:hypothetical protein
LRAAESGNKVVRIAPPVRRKFRRIFDVQD